MIATIEHVRRRLMRQSLAPFAMLVISIRVPSDPAHRTTGYVGVLPVPAPTTTTSSTARSERSDQPVDQARRETREMRAARGRILYADGHAPQATSQRAERKATCTDHRVGQNKSPSSSPNS